MWIDHIMYAYTTENTIVERRDNLVAILQRTAFKTTECTTVVVGDDNIV